ncbi:hypothetical protein Axi01nite_84880 [Actinoplanes xinjiangensis]|nr:hypothetical protein Axi01nite_84880 [Actinoplanes xinjiangensis]
MRHPDIRARTRPRLRLALVSARRCRRDPPSTVEVSSAGSPGTPACGKSTAITLSVDMRARQSITGRARERPLHSTSSVAPSSAASRPAWTRENSDRTLGTMIASTATRRSPGTGGRIRPRWER